MPKNKAFHRARSEPVCDSAAQKLVSGGNRVIAPQRRNKISAVPALLVKQNVTEKFFLSHTGAVCDAIDLQCVSFPVVGERRQKPAESTNLTLRPLPAISWHSCSRAFFARVFWSNT